MSNLLDYFLIVFYRNIKEKPEKKDKEGKKVNVCEKGLEGFLAHQFCRKRLSGEYNVEIHDGLVPRLKVSTILGEDKAPERGENQKNTAKNQPVKQKLL